VGKIILDPALRTKLNGLTDQLEVRDENDQLVGIFLPLAHYQSLLANREVPLAKRPVPFSDEEIAQFKKSGEGCSLADIWKRLGA
jgi:hypothetical protein